MNACENIIRAIQPIGPPNSLTTSSSTSFTFLFPLLLLLLLPFFGDDCLVLPDGAFPMLVATAQYWPTVIHQPNLTNPIGRVYFNPRNICRQNVRMFSFFNYY